MSHLSHDPIPCTEAERRLRALLERGLPITPALGSGWPSSAACTRPR